MKVTLKDGLVIEGTKDQVLEILHLKGVVIESESSLYYSSSRGEFIPITEMNTTHLRNAILKMYRGYVDSWSSIRNPRELVEKMQNGYPDPTWLAMVREYATRPEE